MVLRILNIPSRKSMDFFSMQKEAKQAVETKPSTAESPSVAEKPASTEDAVVVSEPAPAPAPAPATKTPSASTGQTGLLSPTLPTSGTPSIAESSSKPRMARQFSWRNLVGAPQDRKAAPPSSREEAEVRVTARQEYVQRQILRSRADKRARESALVVRELIVGPFAAPTAAPPRSSKVAAAALPSSQQVHKAKAQLLEPRSAQKIIAHLRQLPSSNAPLVVGQSGSGEGVKALPSGPIHAVCLPFTDAEAHEKAFSKLDKVSVVTPSPAVSPQTKERNLDLSAVPSRTVEAITSVTTSSYEKIKEVLTEMDVVSLVTAPDLGLGQPGDGPGLLSGAIPTAKTVIDGVEQITPQLMAIGYATGKSILPSHAGIYPPTDRMSVITYWWGLEVVMPEPSVKYLSNVPSIAHTVINFLTALSAANGGVRELMPFARYISQYIDTEFNSIRAEDRGQGVVCAATWIMPIALVPRPWDFLPPPAASDPADGTQDAALTSALPASSPPDATGDVLAPLPGTDTSPSLVTSPTTTSTEVVAGDSVEDVPGVTVTPPTPPSSRILGSVTAVDPADAADMADENGIAAVGEAGANQGVVNGAPVVAAA